MGTSHFLPSLIILPSRPFLVPNQVSIQGAYEPIIPLSSGPTLRALFVERVPTRCILPPPRVPHTVCGNLQVCFRTAHAPHAPAYYDFGRLLCGCQGATFPWRASMILTSPSMPQAFSCPRQGLHFWFLAQIYLLNASLCPKNNTLGLESIATLTQLYSNLSMGHSDSTRLASIRAEASPAPANQILLLSLFQVHICLALMPSYDITLPFLFTLAPPHLRVFLPPSPLDPPGPASRKSLSNLPPPALITTSPPIRKIITDLTRPVDRSTTGNVVPPQSSIGTGSDPSRGGISFMKKEIRSTRTPAPSRNPHLD
ncbi:hypothetical protein B0H19DRAFT_1098184 [Mycena capillaripes]|nr:hypothetical protein B0H19DRAFT_1098184 [Mycena capillaripes]